MVYLTIGVGVVAATSLLALLWLLFGVNRLNLLASDTGHAPKLEELMRFRSTTNERFDVLEGRIRRLEERLPILEAEVDATLAQAETRFKTARAAEERTRRMAQEAQLDLDEGEGEGGGSGGFEDVLRAVHGEPEEEERGFDETWAGLERAAFNRRHGRR